MREKTAVYSEQNVLFSSLLMISDSLEFQQLDKLAEALPVKIGNYTFQKKIGKGGFSRVFLVTTEQYDMQFVAKVMPKSLMADSGTDISWLVELNHPNIIKVYDCFENDSLQYMILEYCEDGSLHQLIKQKKIVTTDNYLYYMHELLLGFNYCHGKGIAHRDIKPSNVLIDHNGRPKIIDFGISVRAKPGEMVSNFSGSHPYLAPEIILEQPHDPFKADVWALGVTFYVLVASKLPWPKQPEKVMNAAIEQASFILPKNIDPDIGLIIRSMLQVEPNDRPTLQEILDCGLFSDTTHLAPPILHLPPLSPVKRSNSTSYKGKIFYKHTRNSSQNFFVIRQENDRNGSPARKSSLVNQITSLDVFRLDMQQSK